MKIKTAGALLALCITGVFSMHAGAATIDEQFANADNKYTVTLTEDSDIKSVIKIENGKDVTLDLNGHTLTPGDEAGFCVDGSTFTITDNSNEKYGTIDFANKPYRVADALGTEISKSIVAVNSTLTISNAGVKHSYTGEVYEHALIDANNSTINLSSSSLNIPETSGAMMCLQADNNSNVTITDTTINNSTPRDSIGVNTYNSSLVINGSSKITAIEFGLMVDSDPDVDCKFLMTDGTVEASMCAFGMPDAKITGGTISSYIMIGDTLNHEKKVLTITGGTINGELLETVNYGEIIITGGTINVPLNKDDTATISISGGTFAEEPAAEYLAPGFSAETDDNGNYVVDVSPAKLATGSAVTAQGVNNTKATGFVTTISGVESISTISWAVTGNGATKSTEVFEVGNVGGEGDVKIGLIIDGLDDSAAVAKATVNGTINE